MSLDAFAAAGSSWAAGNGQVAAGHAARVNVHLMKAERILNGALTGLDQWDSTTYPHAQLLDDVQDLTKAIAHLDAQPVEADAAQADVVNVGPMYYGAIFGRRVYERQLLRQSAHFQRLNWGGLGHLERYPNVYSAWEAIGAGDYAAARSSLVAMRDTLLSDLNRSLASEAGTLDAAAKTIGKVTP